LEEIHMKGPQYFRALAFLLLTWATAVVPTVAQTPASAQRAQLPGLPNFGRISQQLTRGGQPTPVGFEELKKMGIDIVVNLRHETDEIVREQTRVQKQGMQYVSIPWRGSNNPSPEQIAQFLELLRANPDKKVFVHCQRGAERTGVMLASYRMSHDNWTGEQALREMELFGFRGLRFGHLKKFVREFPSLLLSDPSLAKLNFGVPAR
jgi:protein tyrosine/serine phosphatase